MWAAGHGSVGGGRQTSLLSRRAVGAEGAAGEHRQHRQAHGLEGHYGGRAARVGPRGRRPRRLLLGDRELLRQPLDDEVAQGPLLHALEWPAATTETPI